MNTTSSTRDLVEGHQELADRVIRANQYTNLDAIAVELTAQGIECRRAPLRRYVADLRERDTLCGEANEMTIVTIVEHRTGEVRVIRTSASAGAVEAQICLLRG